MIIMTTACFGQICNNLLFQLMTCFCFLKRLCLQKRFNRVNEALSAYQQKVENVPIQPTDSGLTSLIFEFDVRKLKTILN
jgi:hypothetical protein